MGGPVAHTTSIFLATRSQVKSNPLCLTPKLFQHQRPVTSCVSPVFDFLCHLFVIAPSTGPNTIDSDMLDFLFKGQVSQGWPDERGPS